MSVLHVFYVLYVASVKRELGISPDGPNKLLVKRDNDPKNEDNPKKEDNIKKWPHGGSSQSVA